MAGDFKNYKKKKKKGPRVRWSTGNWRVGDGDAGKLETMLACVGGMLS